MSSSISPSRGGSSASSSSSPPPAAPPTLALSLNAARHTDSIPCLTGNPHTGTQQRVGTLLLHEPVNLVPVLYEDEEDAEGEEEGREDRAMGELTSTFQQATLLFSSSTSSTSSTSSSSSSSSSSSAAAASTSIPTTPSPSPPALNDDGPNPLPEGRGCHLVILSIPAHMIPGELLQFVSPFRDDIRLLRIVSHCLPPLPPSSSPSSLTDMRHQSLAAAAAAASGTSSSSISFTSSSSSPTSQPAKYMALLEMTTPAAADAFFHAFNRRPFNSLEPTRCMVSFLKSLTFATTAAATIPAPAASAAVAGVLVDPSSSSTTSSANSSSSSSSSSSSKSKGKSSSSKKSSSSSSKPPSLLPAFAPSMLHQDIHATSSCSSSSSSTSSSSSSSSSSRGGGGGGGGGRGGRGGGGRGSSSSSSKSSHLPSAGGEEGIPQCVVCLESLGGLLPPSLPPSPFPPLPPSSAPVLITACNHAFHMPCLRRLPSPLCPVCRYNHDDTLAHHSSSCGECGRTTDLWVCLVCGFVGCGRYHAQHSRKHYLMTLHAYAIEVQTQQVWDYVGDGYVHRLLYLPQSTTLEGGREGGKMVEVADPHTRSDQRPRTAPVSEEVEEEVVHRKLESWAEQYTVLLSSGLEEQRQRFEGRLAALRASFPPSLPPSSSRSGMVVAALKQEKRQMEQRCAGARERLRKVREEVGFLCELNKSLEANQEPVAASIRQAEEEWVGREGERKGRVRVLEAQVRELMMQLDGGGAGGEGGGGGEGGKDGGGGVEEAKETECAAAAAAAAAGEGDGERKKEG